MRMFRGRKLFAGHQDQPADAPFTRSVRKGGTAAQHAGTGYDEQHHAPTRLLHQGNGVLQQQEAAGEVDVDDSPPGRFGIFVDVRPRIDEDGRWID